MIIIVKMIPVTIVVTKFLFGHLLVAPLMRLIINIIKHGINTNKRYARDRGEPG